MTRIILIDPSVGTSNIGDQIIYESIAKHMDFLFKNHFVVRYSSHTPLVHLHQLLKTNFITKNCDSAQFKFLGGSSILKGNLLKYTLDWNVNIFTSSLYKDSICIGARVEGDSFSIPNLYTRKVYDRILSKDYIHSVRDDRAKVFLESMGFKAINTGCPTTWDLTSQHCAKIPTKKSERAIFTLTDYRPDRGADEQLLTTLLKNYRDVIFWPQAAYDLEYFKTLPKSNQCKVLGPSLNAYREILKAGDIDYVGTRLHAGIFAMQYAAKSIIIGIDNRARDMAKSFNINFLDRCNINQLDKQINTRFSTDIGQFSKNIEEWKKQFKSNE